MLYNHTYVTEGSNFNNIVPAITLEDDTGKFTNGSGTGNEVASERPMVRKYIKTLFITGQKNMMLRVLDLT